MPAFIEKLNTWYEDLPNRRRGIVIAGIACTCMLALYLVLRSDSQVTDTAMPNMAKQKPAESQAIIPQVYPVQTIRDPFVPPPDFGKPEKPIPSSSAGDQLLPSAPNQGHNIGAQNIYGEVLPQLMGVVSGGNRQMAILQYDNISRSYFVGENIGPYTLIKVEVNSVIVVGPGGRRALTLGR